MTPEIIRGDRIDLHRASSRDVPEITQSVLESIDQLVPWCPWCNPGYEESHADQYLTLCETNWESGAERVFTIRDKAGKCLGTCGLNDIHDNRKSCNLGYWLRSSATGNGFATEAVRLLSGFAIDNLQLVRVEIVVAVKNDPSHGVAKRAGAIREGVLANRIPFHDQFFDAVMYSITPESRAKQTSI